MLEDEADHDEVGGDGDGEDGDGGELAAEAQPEEKVEQHDVEQVVDQVGTAKTDAILGGGLLVEREARREVVVDQEAQDVTHGVGHVDIDPVLQHPVDDVVDGGSRGADNAEADEFAKGLFLVHLLAILTAKVQNI